MDLHQQKKELKNALPEEGINYVIKALMAILPEHSAHQNSLLNIKSQFKNLQLKRIKGTLTQEQFDASTADIRSRLLLFIDGLEQADFNPKSKTSKKPSYKKGAVLYHIPKQMQVFKETRCRVRIAFNEEMLIEDLDLDKDMTIKSAVRISDRMKVEIIDPSNDAFEVRTTSDLIQLIDEDDYTEWRFYVKPLRPGEHVLELKVSIIVIKDGKETKREKTLEESVVIIAEKVEEEEEEFINAMNDIIIPVPQSDTPLTDSGFRLPKAVKAMAIGLLMIMISSTATYAFVPVVQLEVDWFVVDKIKADKKSYNGFVEKYKTKEKSSPKITKRLKAATVKVEDFEWQEVKVDSSGQEAVDYLKKYSKGRYLEKAVEQIETIEWKKVVSKTDTTALVKSIIEYLHRFPLSPKADDAKILLKKMTIAKPQLIKTIDSYKKDLSKIIIDDIAAKKSLELRQKKLELRKEQKDSLRIIQQNKDLVIQQRKQDSLAIINKEKDLVIQKAKEIAIKKEQEKESKSTIIPKVPTPKKSTKNSFTDSRDGQTYQWIRLKDGKKWMTQNLSFDMGKDCWFPDGDSKNEKEYGRLYTWEAAKKACPRGWHLPSDEEWWKMASFYGKAFNSYDGQEKNNGGEAAYKALMEGGNSDFAAVLGGLRDTDGSFGHLGVVGYYWSSTEGSSSNAWYYYFYSNSQSRSDDNRTAGLSCRCLQN